MTFAGRTSVFAGLAVLLSGAALAAPPRPSTPPVDAPLRPGREDRRAGREHLRDEVMDQMRTMRMWRITQELKLDEATAAKVFPLLARSDDQDREVGRECGEIFRSLRDQLLSATPDSMVVNGLIDRLISNRARKMALEQEKVIALRKTLSPIQQAKLLMLLPRIEEEFHQRIREAMDRNGRGSGPRGAFDGTDRPTGPRP